MVAQSDNCDKRYRSKPDIGISDIGSKMAESGGRGRGRGHGHGQGHGHGPGHGYIYRRDIWSGKFFSDI